MFASEVGGLVMRYQLKVLVLEDDLLYCYFLRRWLELQGYSVVEAYNLYEFQHLVLEEDPDIVVLDIGIPKDASPLGEYLPLGGLTAIEWISTRDDVLKPDAVIVISAVLPSATREKLRRYGVTAIFEKPFDIGSLVCALHRGVRKTESRRRC